MKEYRLTDWLPTTKKEVELRGWDELDVILFSGDAYVDHPSFGPAVICRILEAQGLRVAIVPQPNWRDDLRDFKKLGRPRLFFGISAGCMDSMVNKYTANKRLRSEDAYTPDGRPDMRPEYPSIVYSQILKKLYPDVPVILGSIEASLRRLSHYDYWQDKVQKSILCDSGADLLIYGMGEKPIVELTRKMKELLPVEDASLTAGELKKIAGTIPQTAYLCRATEWTPAANDIQLYSHEECLADKKKQASNFRHIEEESNKYAASRITQEVDNKVVIVNPPYPPPTTRELDAVYALPFTRLPHPRYKGKEIPAYNMIRHSVTLHRGCFGGCAFCTISAHQGKFIVSRSPESIRQELEQITAMPDFKGTVTDLGGPSANMYHMKGKNEEICRLCKRASCAYPTVCKNLNTDHGPLLRIYEEARQVPGIKHCFIGSGIRYDLCLSDTGNKEVDKTNRRYLETVIRHHVSGRFKVAPEHCSPTVLGLMRKPAFGLFQQLKSIFDEINRKHRLNEQIIPYFISSHPGCRPEDMAELAVATKALDFKLEQVQDFTPTPMTVATTIYYSGYHPYSLQKIDTAKSEKEKKQQNMFFFWYKREFREQIMTLLRRIHRADLIPKLYGKEREK